MKIKCYIAYNGKIHECEAVAQSIGYLITAGAYSGNLYQEIHRTPDLAKQAEITRLRREKNQILSSINQRIKTADEQIKIIESLDESNIKKLLPPVITNANFNQGYSGAGYVQYHMQQQSPYERMASQFIGQNTQFTAQNAQR
jgi:hypothetical protein